MRNTFTCGVIHKNIYFCGGVILEYVYNIIVMAYIGVGHGGVDAPHIYCSQGVSQC